MSVEILVHADNAGLIRRFALPASDGKAFQSVRISREVLDQAGACLQLSCSLPIIDVQGFWHPERSRPCAQLHWHIGFKSAAQRNFPYLTFFEQGQKNRATFALSCLHNDVAVTAKMNQQEAIYHITFVIAVDAATEAFDFLVSFLDCPWPELLAEYREAVAISTPVFPPAAFLPVYCTWYAVHAALTMAYLDQNAALAAKLGFGTFIVDDGWCFDEMKRVTPASLAQWYDRIGDWELSENKLPDFPAHIARAQRLGLRYMLWVAPFFVGTASRAMAGIEDTAAALLTRPHEGQCIADPRCVPFLDRTRAKLLQHFIALGLDGYKIDFLDAVEPSVTSPRSREVLAFIRQFVGDLRAEKPDVLIEFRQHYATPLMLAHATQFRAGDVPFDYLENIHRIAQIRIVLGDGVPVHADPVCFNPGEAAVNVSRHMIAALAGVPMLSLDLVALSPEQTRIIAHWLDFHRDHRQTFSCGHWRVSYRLDQLDWISVTHGNARIAILLNAASATEALAGFAGQAHLLNLTSVPIAIGAGVAYDGAGTSLEGGQAPCGGRLHLA
jgi:alpha-galactosidase